MASFVWNRLQSLSRTERKVHSSTQKPPPLPYIDCDIYDACLERDWAKAEELCREHPHNTEYQEGDNLETPLYMACQNNPPLSTIQALLHAFSKAVSTKSRRGDLPLHMACWEGAPANIIRALVDEDPSTATQTTRWGQTPLAILWERHQVHVLSKTLQENIPRILEQQRDGTTIPAADAARYDDENEVCSHLLTVTDILLQAVARHRQASCPNPACTVDHPLFIAHAAISLGSTGCPVDVLSYVAGIFKDQFQLRDCQGQLPLHVLVRGANSSSKCKFMPREGTAIQMCLALYPPSGWQCDPNEPPGRYPLHTALLNGHEWDEGIGHLVSAAPAVLRRRDPILGIFPFQMSRQGGKNPDAASKCRALDLCYNLLRADPSVLKQQPCTLRELGGRPAVDDQSRVKSLADVLLSMMGRGGDEVRTSVTAGPRNML